MSSAKYDQDFLSDSDEDTIIPSDLSEADDSDSEVDDIVVNRTRSSPPPSIVSPPAKADDPSVFESAPGHDWTKMSRDNVPVVFTKASGVVAESVQGCKRPLDFFFLFFDEDIIEIIRSQTELYNKQQNNKCATPLIDPITTEEMYGFVGINFLMGYHTLPSLRHYWSTDPHLGLPLVYHTMTRNRFASILSNLHINDNDQIPKDNKDKLIKVRPLISSLNEKFRTHRLPGQYLSVDESTIKFKGRSSLKQYNPMKPNKRHIKLWACADMAGFIHWFDVYQGANGELDSDIDADDQQDVSDEKCSNSLFINS